MHGSLDAGMLRGWIMLWNMELIWLIAATAAAVALGAGIEVVAALRRRLH
ncbi:MAG TPA: hypothetical protein VMU81_10780 [Acetobacteraceae bacterium]|nr:hypothetical protein [Acetobacteraceae bacterium]